MIKLQFAQNKGMLLKIAITWLCLFLLLGFLISTRAAEGTVTLSVMPEIPRTGEPVVATFNINNPSTEPLTTSYEFYINGVLAEGGVTTIAPLSGARYQYAYENHLERGEQVNFLLKTGSEGSSFEKKISLPAYPPQLMSSFVSFAAFSTSVMSSMVSMQYFNDTFGVASKFNAGITLVIVLVALLIFLELVPVAIAGKKAAVLIRYRADFRVLSTILFIIFLGMAFTQVVMTLTA